MNDELWTEQIQILLGTLCDLMKQHHLNAKPGKCILIIDVKYFTAFLFYVILTDKFDHKVNDALWTGMKLLWKYAISIWTN